MMRSLLVLCSGFVEHIGLKILGMISSYVFHMYAWVYLINTNEYSREQCHFCLDMYFVFLVLR